MSKKLAVKLAADKEKHVKKAAVEKENDEGEEDDPDLRLASSCCAVSPAAPSFIS